MKHFVKNIYIHIIKMEKISPLVDSHVLALATRIMFL